LRTLARRAQVDNLCLAFFDESVTHNTLKEPITLRATEVRKAEQQKRCEMVVSAIVVFAVRLADVLPHMYIVSLPIYLYISLFTAQALIQSGGIQVLKESVEGKRAKARAFLAENEKRPLSDAEEEQFRKARRATMMEHGLADVCSRFAAHFCYTVFYFINVSLLFESAQLEVATT
jgi:hypothetical protein